jgi:hypothetical protein
MKRLFGQEVFSTAGRTYCWEDVVLGAALWGEWAAIETRTRRGLACLARSRRGDEKLDKREVAAAANAFRYERDLISGDEAKAWLAGWGLTVEAWMEYVQWTLLRERSAMSTADDVAVSAGQIASHIVYEAVCSGDLARLARMLAGRVAVAELAAEEATDAGATDGESDSAAARLDAVLAPDGWPGGSAQALRDKAENLRLVERRYAASLPRLVTSKATAEQIRTHYLDWLRIDSDVTAFPTEDMAKEVALSVREDGMTLVEVAAEVGRPVKRYSGCMDGYDRTVKNVLLAATPGDLVGPFFHGGAYHLLHVLEKTVPSRDDPETVERAERATLEAALARETNGRVRWHWRL